MKTSNAMNSDGLHFIWVLEKDRSAYLHVYKSLQKATSALNIFSKIKRGAIDPSIGRTGSMGISQIGHGIGNSKMTIDDIASSVEKKYGMEPEVIRHDVASNPVKQTQKGFRMKTKKFDDGSYTVLGIKSDLFDGESDGVFDPDGNLLKARIRFPSGLARAVTRHGAVWKEIQAVGEIRTTKRKTRTLRPKAVRKTPARKTPTRKTPAPFEKPRGRRISREEQYRHDFREEQKAIAARIQGKEYVPTRYPEPRPKADSGNYSSFGAWASAVRRAGGTVRSQLSEPQSAYNRSGDMIGEWDGQSGMIIRKNPVRQRIAVSLSRSQVRRNPFNDRNLDA